MNETRARPAYERYGRKFSRQVRRLVERRSCRLEHAHDGDFGRDRAELAESRRQERVGPVEHADDRDV